MTELSNELKTAVVDLVGCGLTAAAWEQATLPISDGGLGIKDPLTTWPQARVSALTNFHRNFGNVGLPSDIGTAPGPDQNAAVAALLLLVGPNNEAASRLLDAPASILSAPIEFSQQSWWADQVGKTRRLRAESLGTARDQVRMAAQEGPLATAWLAVTPSKTANTLLYEDEFRCLCRFWLGLPLFAETQAVECPLCKEAADPYGDHFVNCNKNGWTRRHNALRDELCRNLTIGGINHFKEPIAVQRDRPADILLLGWDKGTDVCVDLTITNPLSAENYPLNPETAKRHLSLAEQRKTIKHKQSCEAMRWSAHPAAFSPWGGAGPAAKSLLFEITKRIAGDLHPAIQQERSTEIRQNLSLALVREIAKQLQVRNQVLNCL